MTMTRESVGEENPSRMYTATRTARRSRLGKIRCVRVCNTYTEALVSPNTVLYKEEQAKIAECSALVVERLTYIFVSYDNIRAYTHTCFVRIRCSNTESQFLNSTVERNLRCRYDVRTIIVRIPRRGLLLVLQCTYVVHIDSVMAAILRNPQNRRFGVGSEFYVERKKKIVESNARWARNRETDTANIG